MKKFADIYFPLLVFQASDGEFGREGLTEALSAYFDKTGKINIKNLLGKLVDSNIKDSESPHQNFISFAINFNQYKKFGPVEIVEYLRQCSEFYKQWPLTYLLRIHDANLDIFKELDKKYSYDTRSTNEINEIAAAESIDELDKNIFLQDKHLKPFLHFAITCAFQGKISPDWLDEFIDQHKETSVFFDAEEVQNIEKILGGYVDRIFDAHSKNPEELKKILIKILNATKNKKFDENKDVQMLQKCYSGKLVLNDCFKKIEDVATRSFYIRYTIGILVMRDYEKYFKDVQTFKRNYKLEQENEILREENKSLKEENKILKNEKEEIPSPIVLLSEEEILQKIKNNRNKKKDNPVKEKVAETNQESPIKSPSKKKTDTKKTPSFKEDSQYSLSRISITNTNGKSLENQNNNVTRNILDEFDSLEITSTSVGNKKISPKK